MTDITKLISYLIAIANFAKDIHYSTHGEAFYAKHEFADLIQSDLNDYIDLIKEICLLGNEIAPLPSGEYLSRATSLIPLREENNDRQNFEKMKNLLIETLSLLEGMDNLTRGENNLLDDIAQNLQQKLGLVNQEVK